MVLKLLYTRRAIAFTLEVVKGFFGYISPKPERIWMKPGSEGSRGALTPKLGEIPQGFQLDAKTCFGFSVTNTTRTFGHFSCTDFEHF